MDLEAKPYRYFLAVAETGSFSRSAEAMHISQPALSAQIRELERRIGFDLFTRTSRRVELTAEGSEFLDKARRLVMETDWINQAARDIRTNQLRIGAAHHSALIPERRRLIEQFMLSHPQIALKVTGGAPMQLYAELSRQEIDIAITLEPHAETGGFSIVEAGVSEEFERLSLGRRPVEILCPIDQDWADGETIPHGGLAGQRVLTINRSHGVSLSEAVARHLSDAGAHLAHPPEGDALSIAHYAEVLRTPAINLGWFVGPGGDTNRLWVSKAAADLPLSTDLVMLRSRRPQRPAASLLWGAAARVAERERPA